MTIPNPDVPGALDRLVELGDMRFELDGEIRAVVVELRGMGVPWGQIGAALRVTGEAVRQRFGS